MASLTRWTWVWASSGSWWRAGKPGVLQSMESQRTGHNWVTELTDPAYKGWFNVTQLLTQLRYRPPAHTLLSLAWYTQYPSCEKTVPGIGLLTQSSSSQYSPWHEITLPMMELLYIRHSRGTLVNPANPAAIPYCIFHTSTSKNVLFPFPFIWWRTSAEVVQLQKLISTLFCVCHRN